MEKRFSRSELRAIQLGLAIIVVSFFILALTVNTLVMPAVKSLRLTQTKCTIYSEKVRMKPRKSLSLWSILDENTSDNENIHEEIEDCVQVTVKYHIMLVNYDNPSFNKVDQRFIVKKENLLHKEENSKPPKNNALVSFVEKAILYLTDLDMFFRNEPCYPRSTYVRALDATTHGYEYNGRDHLKQTFKCFYDPHNPNIIIATRTFSYKSIFHGIFWPFLLLLLGVAIVSIVYYCIAKMKNDLRPSQGIIEKNNPARHNAIQYTERRKTQTRIQWNEKSLV
ncbi:uncharacterized protein LOC143446435 isoform X1 [Clavelina lepadiformis]|uniref:uncharacterized protein LOC143446435 isoform X1 n=2 Tax=Clavelina lepadiformis TaxID=159417 RepID=UPI0040424497